MITIVFGDSIAWGANDNKHGGWVEMLKREEMKNFNFVYNCSISGNTTYDIVSRLTDEIDYRLDVEDDLRIIFAVGINDASRIKKELRVDEVSFKNNLIDIIIRAKAYTDDIWFVGLTKVNEKKSTPVAWDDELTYHNKDILNYDNILKKLVIDNDCKFIDIYALGTATDDGVHLTTFGHQTMIKLISNELSK